MTVHVDSQAAVVSEIMKGSSSLPSEEVALQIVEDYDANKFRILAMPSECTPGFMIRNPDHPKGEERRNEHPTYTFVWVPTPLSAANRATWDYYTKGLHYAVCNRATPSPEHWTTVGKPDSEWRFETHGGIERAGMLLLVNWRSALDELRKRETAQATSNAEDAAQPGDPEGDTDGRILVETHSTTDPSGAKAGIIGATVNDDGESAMLDPELVGT